MSVRRALPILVVTVPLLVAGVACGSSGGTHNDAAAYCAKAKSLDGAAESLGRINISDKAAVKSAMLGLQTDAHSALEQAPTTIRADAAVVVRDLDDLVGILAKADYDVKKVNSQDIARISNQGTDAQTRVTEYNQKTCGLLPSASTTQAPGQPATTVTTGVGSG